MLGHLLWLAVLDRELGKHSFEAAPLTP